MRGLTAFIFGALAAIAVAVLLPVSWVATHIASEDGYVSLSESMVQDAQFRDDLMAATADEIVARAALPSVTVEPMRTALTTAADALAASPRFVDAWAETQRQSHRAVFADPRDLSADMDASNRLAIDVAPLAQAVVDAATDRLPVRVDVPGQMLVTVGGSEQHTLIDQIRSSPDRALVLAALALGSAIIAVIAARRRWNCLAWLGVAAVVAAVVVRVVSHAVVPHLLDRSAAPSDLARSVQQLLADRAVASLDSWGLAVMIVGVVIAGVGWVASAAQNSFTRSA